MATSPEQVSPTAIWSAVAASLSAVSAFIMLWIQHRNWIESVRPEILLLEWKRVQKPERRTESIVFKSIKNIGKGAAFNVHYHVHFAIDNKPIAILTNGFVPVIASNESTEIQQGEIHLFWGNLPGEDQQKSCFFPLSVFCTDGRWMRYETKFAMVVFQAGGNFAGAMTVAPGVSFSRTIHAKSLWRLRLSQKLVDTYKKTAERLRK